jgi:hypothetical protein
MPSYIPTKPSASFQSGVFPADLLADRGSTFYTNINFVKYSNQYNSTLGGIANLVNGGLNFFGLGSAAAPKSIPLGGFNLPLPSKINEVQTVTWQDASAISQAASLAQNGIGTISNGMASNLLSKASNAAGDLGEFGGAESGLALNPQLYMLFKSPNFKEHMFSWTFTPNNEQESNELRNIINSFKFYSLPSTYGLFYNYPSIAMIQFMPDDYFAFKIKPCALVSVNVDYSGGGRPSFFKNGAPTVVNLGLAFKEIELWNQDNYES